MQYIKQLLCVSEKKEIGPKQALVRYVYLDVVQFTLNRSVEDQTFIITSLNDIVTEATLPFITKSNQVIFIPIGDGLCIALFGSEIPYDAHISIAFSILKLLAGHNKKLKGSKQFQVRIGLNQNDDNIIRDINGRKNVAGAGVNHAQRVMSHADGNQIIVGKTVHESLNCRQNYMNKFRPFTVTIKHNQTIEVFQFIDTQLTFLNSDIPTQLQTNPQKEPVLSQFAAYYFAHSIKNQDYILTMFKKENWKSYAFPCILHYLAIDSIGALTSSEFYPYENKMPFAPNGTFAEQYVEFNMLPFWLNCDFGDMALVTYGIKNYRNCFLDQSNYTVVNDTGKEKLKKEWPSVWTDFNLDN